WGVMSYHARVVVLIANGLIRSRNGSRHCRIGVVAISSWEQYGQWSDNLASTGRYLITVEKGPGSI
ncbi:MAG: hypothetical protein, partial [Olavius algarvensis Gamma 1 endosymbiont]